MIPRNFMSYLHIYGWICAQHESARVLGKFIVGFAHYKNISHRICTLPKIVGFAHTRQHVIHGGKCRICTKAQGKNENALPAEM
ncbi:hypothetical protein PJM43_0019 [Salmonella phage vB_SenS_UTK0008]|nr:hypothetical protein PJM43_0019 [Salmonella phage vB_SenS_UTK0008]